MFDEHFEENLVLSLEVAIYIQRLNIFDNLTEDCMIYIFPTEWTHWDVSEIKMSPSRCQN